MKQCPNCKIPLVGYVHSNGKEEGKMCLKCKQIYETQPIHISTMHGDYEELILARQETNFD